LRIVLLTPGTGSFYCGTCIRDNALAVALRKQGHDAMMVPLYLPPALDEAAASENAPLFYGGINVYLQQKVGLFRHTPRWADRFFDTPPLLQTAARRAGMTQAHDLGDLTVSMLRGEDGRQVKELNRLVSWLASDGKADVVCLSNALLMGLARRIKTETGALVACTLQGEDTFLDSLPPADAGAAWETLAERAVDVDAFIAVSHYHADLMRARANLPAEKVHVVYNGILLDGYAEDAPPPAVPALGYLARMCPPKGLETLVEAFILLRRNNRIPNLQLKVAGARTEADLPFVTRLQARLSAEGLSGDAVFLPNISRTEKIAFLQSLSVLSVPATYGESFGLYVVEALAAGVPVVQPRHAVFPELLAQTGGGALCEPDDPASLAAVVEDLLLDPARARALGQEGQRTVRAKFGVDEMARNTAAVFAGAGGEPGRNASALEERVGQNG
jgi:glycosyltransferase involved in cell wall biosynthesis